MAQPVKMRQTYDPHLRPSNDASRHATEQDINLREEALLLIASMQVEEIMDLADRRREDFSQIHANIRDFYLLSNRITPEQKATMGAFLLRHQDLLFPPEAAKPTQVPAEVVTQENTEEAQNQSAESGT